MNFNCHTSFVSACMGVGMFFLSGCRTGYSITSIEGGRLEVTAALDKHPDAAALAVLAPYRRTVDSIMSPVIGQSARFMDCYRPESELSNLVADILRTSTSDYIGREAEVALVNMGGLRTSLPEGNITFGNIYEITPFENSLCIVRMKGTLLKQLFGNIAQRGGEGLSGARLVISKNGQLLSASVGGKPVKDEQVYTVATLDYLAEGNDRMTAFTEVSEADKVACPEAILRRLFLNYVNEQTRAGKKIDAEVEGRILIKE